MAVCICHELATAVCLKFFEPEIRPGVWVLARPPQPLICNVCCVVTLLQRAGLV